MNARLLTLVSGGLLALVITWLHFAAPDDPIWMPEPQIGIHDTHEELWRNDLIRVPNTPVRDYSRENRRVARK
jgi:hypothetical protein